MPCSDERPGDREHSQHMRDGAALLCSICRGEIFPEDPTVLQWYALHQEYDANHAKYGSFHAPKSRTL